MAVQTEAVPCSWLVEASAGEDEAATWQSPMSAYFNPQASGVGTECGSFAPCDFELSFGMETPKGSAAWRVAAEMPQLHVPQEIEIPGPIPVGDQSKEAWDPQEIEIPEPLPVGDQNEAAWDLQAESFGAESSGSTFGLDWHLPSRYHLGPLLGVGSYGSVCEAWDTKEQRAVAVKKVERLFQSTTHCTRILREVTILSHLRHSHVVRIFDLPKPEDLRRFDEIYIVMERCDSDLRKVCEDPQGVSMPQARKLAYGMLVGCRYLHAAGIYHRDLKPANCLVNRDCSVKICDFNLARSMPALDFENVGDDTSNTEPEEPKMLSRSLTVHVASRWYRPPEVLLELGYSEAMDVWSAGCIIGELFGALNEGGNRPKRQPLFPGSQCFPLSSIGSGSSWSDDGPRFCGDQLDVILGILGMPSNTDLEALPARSAALVMARLRCYAHRPGGGSGLRARLPREVSGDGADLLERMLRFLPHHRISIAEALKQPFFARVQRSPDEGKTEHEALDAGYDETDLDGLWALELRGQLRREIGRFHPPGASPQNSLSDGALQRFGEVR